MGISINEENEDGLETVVTGKEEIVYTGEDQDILPKKTFTVDIEMENIKIYRRKNNKVEINGLTGRIYHNI